MIENTDIAFRASRAFLVSALALSVSPWAAGQDAPSPGAPDKLNLQLPTQSASPASYTAGYESKRHNEANVEAVPQASQGNTQNVPRFSYADMRKQPPSSTSTAERAFQAHKDMFNRQSRCPTPFDPVPSPTAAPRESQLPNCQAWRKPASIR